MKSPSVLKSLAFGAVVVSVILLISGFVGGPGSLIHLQASGPAALIGIFLLLFDRWSGSEEDE